MPISHTGIKTTPQQVKALTSWYESALKPLGYKKIRDFLDGMVNGFGDESGHADWWVSATQESGTPLPSHHAFVAKDRATVDAFHKAGIDAGGKDNGEPGLRPYAPGYYAAFVLDPAGNNIEAVYMGEA